LTEVKKGRQFDDRVAARLIKFNAGCVGCLVIRAELAGWAMRISLREIRGPVASQVGAWIFATGDGDGLRLVTIRPMVVQHLDQ
jgi:hypothetical protein